MVGFEATGRVAVITIRRPEARNAIDGAVAAGIEASLDNLECDDQLWAGVLAGEGPVFCAGADLRAIASGQSDRLATRRGGFAGLTRRQRRKPLVAAVEGPALAGGFEIVLACDMVVASRKAVFGLPEVRRSLVATGGGLFRLPRSVGAKVAMEMILCGEPITAERAWQLGLVNRVVDAGSALQMGIELASKVVGNAPIAVRESRRVVEMAFATDDRSLWNEIGLAASAVASSEDFSEGPRAFLEGRDPVWKGR